MAAKAAYKEVSEKIRKKAKKAKSPPWRRSETTLDEDDVEGALVTLRRLRVELFHRPYTVIDIPGDDEDNRKDGESPGYTLSPAWPVLLQHFDVQSSGI